MSVSPFGFFRGAAPLMAYDLSLTPNSAVFTQLCGDAHVENLGAYAGADGRLVFDINDFDETTPGPFEFDVKRMATSLLLAAGHTHEHPAHHATHAFLDAYCALIRQFASLPVLEIARFQVHGLHAESPIATLLTQAERATPIHLRDQLTDDARHGRRFRDDPPLLARITGSDRKEILASLSDYRASLLPEHRHAFDQFKALDVAFKVVGTGSVGLRDYIVYLEGNGPEDPLFLQLKQENKSCYTPYLKQLKQHQGRRVAEGQRAMQLQSDPMLGWTTIDKRDYFVRQLNDHKATLDATQLSTASLLAYAHVCGQILARGHARSGNAKALARAIEKQKPFKERIFVFAQSYAAQTIADWKLYTKQH